jgi:soluble lytic murein transglycosylase
VNSGSFWLRSVLPAAALLLTAVAGAQAQIQLTGASEPVPLGRLAESLSIDSPEAPVLIRVEPMARSWPFDAPARSDTGGRHSPFNDIIGAHAELNALRPELVRAVVRAESAFNPVARSVKGALGLMQLMPETARQFGVSNPFDPEENVRAGTAYLRQLLDRYGNREELALAAYNAGPGAVDRYGQSVPPYRETLQYVKTVSEMAGEAPRAVMPRIFRRIERVDGREVITYTNRRTR